MVDVSHVLVYEAFTKLVMAIEGCNHLQATGLALGVEKPSRTPYGMKWESLVAEAKQRRNTNYGSKRKQLKPRRVVRKKSLILVLN